MLPPTSYATLDTMTSMIEVPAQLYEVILGMIVKNVQRIKKQGSYYGVCDATSYNSLYLLVTATSLTD